MMEKSSVYLGTLLLLNWQACEQKRETFKMTRQDDVGSENSRYYHQISDVKQVLKARKNIEL